MELGQSQLAYLGQGILHILGLRAMPLTCNL